MYSIEEHIFFIKSYYSSNQNLKHILAEYGITFNVKRNKWPSKNVIIRLVKKFEETGSVHNNKKGKVGAKRTARTPENIAVAQ
ncbi:hypothetical protein PGB90_002781 [Kerria lacca]